MPAGGLIPQFVGVEGGPGGSTMMTTSVDGEDTTADASTATAVATNTAPLEDSSTPATNSSLESVTAPVSLTKVVAVKQVLAGESIEKVSTTKQATVVDPTPPDTIKKMKGDVVTADTVKRAAEKDASPPAKKVRRESINTRKTATPSGRVTRATAAVSRT